MWDDLMERLKYAYGESQRNEGMGVESIQMMKVIMMMKQVNMNNSMLQNNKWMKKHAEMKGIFYEFRMLDNICILHSAKH